MSSRIINGKEILRIYLHRFPMLLVDEIEVQKDGVCIGQKNVTFSEIWFQGHFPNDPILPGVIIVETMSQVGGMCFYDDFYSEEKEQTLGIMVAYDKVRFMRKVIPGDRMKIVATKIGLFSGVGKVKTEAFVRDERVASAELTYKFEKVNQEK